MRGRLRESALVKGFRDLGGLGVDVDGGQLLLDLRHILARLRRQQVQLPVRAVRRQHLVKLLRQLPDLRPLARVSHRVADACSGEDDGARGQRARVGCSPARRACGCSC